MSASLYPHVYSEPLLMYLIHDYYLVFDANLGFYKKKRIRVNFRNIYLIKIYFKTFHTHPVVTSRVVNVH